MSAATPRTATRVLTLVAFMALPRVVEAGPPLILGENRRPTGENQNSDVQDP